MKKVCFCGFPNMDDFHGYKIESFDPMPYFPDNARWGFSDLIHRGINGYLKKRALREGIVGVDRLYRERDPHYMKMASDFVSRFYDFDLIIMAVPNFIHPEILSRDLKKPIKILGFIDDPYSTYQRGIPYLWAFDGAFFISPSYLNDLNFKNSISRWGCEHSTWWPLVPREYSLPQRIDNQFFEDRNVDVVYVGGPYSNKMDKLITLKRYFGDRFQVHGRWPFAGFYGFIRGAMGKPIFPYRVTSLGDDELSRLYWNTKIGFNMHLSNEPVEGGNMRTYMSAAHGMMMLSDKAGGDFHENIFKPNNEAVYYDNIDDAIDLIDFYLKNNEMRLNIARAGFARYWSDYEWSGNLIRLLQWAENIHSKHDSL